MFYLVQLECSARGHGAAGAAHRCFAARSIAHGKRVYRINQFWTWLILRIRRHLAARARAGKHRRRASQYHFHGQSSEQRRHPGAGSKPCCASSSAGSPRKNFLRVPFFGWAMWATKHITVDRADPLDAVKSLERARERIAAGISVVVFPEGTRSRDGHLLPFKKGGFLLAAEDRRQDRPGHHRRQRGNCWPAGAWRLRAGTIDVFVDRPIAHRRLSRRDN